MTAISVTAKTKDSESVTVTYDFGDTVDEMASICSANGADGLDVVFTNARANMKISVQDLIRSGIDSGDSAAKIQKSVTAYVPGVKKKGKTKAEKMRDEFDKLSVEEKQELLDRLTSGG